jgi:4-amino-4-deoxy-L-arabinose transferase-like glycosyltransferase
VEPLVLLAGLVLRWGIGRRFDPTWGYDWAPHMGYLEHIVNTGHLPDPSLTAAAYHPPLYYWLGATLIRAGAGPDELQALSLLLGSARLVVTWLGLRVLLPNDRLARVAGLAIAAILPCALHGDAMVTNESLNALLATAATILGYRMLSTEGRIRVRFAAGFAVVLAGALLTKVSCIILLPIVGAAAVAQQLLSPAPWRERGRALVPPIAALTLACAIALPVYAAHHKTSPSILATGFECSPFHRAKFEKLKKTSYLDRRTLGYVVGMGSRRTWSRPVYPTKPSRFWPVLVASTFGDYLNYQFTGPLRPGETSTVEAVGRPVRKLALLRASVFAGAAVALVTVGGLILAAWRTFKARDVAMFALLAFPVAAVLGQLHFSIKYPFDDEGMIKGHYMVFAALPLFHAFGTCVSAAWRSKWSRPIAFVALIALGVVATYSATAAFG